MKASADSLVEKREALKAKYTKLGVREIKQKLDDLGISTASLFDKESLLDALVQAESLVCPQSI